MPSDPCALNLRIQALIFVHMSNSICKMALSSKKEVVTAGTKHKRKAAAEKNLEKESASSKKKSVLFTPQLINNYISTMYISTRSHCFSERVMWHSSIHQLSLETIRRFSDCMASSCD